MLDHNNNVSHRDQLYVDQRNGNQRNVDKRNVDKRHHNIIYLDKCHY